ncbi:MAG: PAS domain S-box protein [Phycisphaerae bacterium]|nr:PAS domain S-box protein [Phycisphaerae bacterium]
MKATRGETISDESLLSDCSDVLAHVIAAIPAALWVHREGRIVYASEQTCELTGYPMEEMVGLELRALLHPDARTIAQAWGPGQSIDRPSISRYEIRILRKDGRTLWLDYVTSPVRYRGEAAFLGIGSDMTERKLTSDRLRESERALSTLLSNLPGMAYRCRNDADWTMEFVSEGCAELTGYAAEAIVENRLVAYADVIHEEDRQLVWNAVQQGVDRRQPFRMTYRIRTAEGVEKVVWEQGRGVFDAAGNLQALEGFITDITDWHRAEQELREARESLERRVEERTRALSDSYEQVRRAVEERVQAVTALDESEKRIQTIVDNSPAVIYAKAADGRYILTNRVFEQMFHFTRDQIVGHTDVELFTPNYAEAFQANDRRVRDTGVPIEFEERVPQDDGEHIYLSVKFPLHDLDGRVYAVCGVSTDITEKKRAEVELRRAKAAAEAASQAKSRFLANISHEIRTPITAMLGAAELVNRESSKNLPRRLETIVRNGEYLLSLINDLLDAARIEAGKLQVDCADVSLVSVIADCCAIVESLGRSPDVEFRVEVVDAIPAVIHTDATRLKQAIVNLLNNAFKFTHAGHILLQVRTGEDKRHVVFAVADTGVGIPSSRLEGIFEAFAQLDRQPIAGKVGAGLGLSLTRWIAEQLGGDIHVTSVEEQGSTFTLRVAIGNCADESRLTPEDAYAELHRLRSGASATSRRLKGRVLIADDFPDARELLGLALRGAGAEVVLVGDGHEAVCEAVAQPFDLILLDIRMPGMDGNAAGRELRRRGCLAPIIALTASVSGANNLHVVDPCFDDFWSKPIPLDTLIERSAAYLQSADVETRESQPPPDNTAQMDEVRHRYARELPRRAETLQEAIERGAFAEAREILHQMVGTSGIVGFSEVSEAAVPVLEAVRSGNTDEAQRLLARLREIIDSATTGLP